MRYIQFKDIMACRSTIANGIPVHLALMELDGISLHDGFWRIFSKTYPADGGVMWWNSSAAWKSSWDLPEKDFYAFGEDIFGNQLVFFPPEETTFLWDHESGELFNLILPAVDLLETCLIYGVEWIDFYQASTLTVAQTSIRSVSMESHIHWIQPLILGGSTVIENTSIIERRQHLIGHAALWRQLRGLDPGTNIILTP